MSSTTILKQLYYEEKRLKTFQDKGWPLSFLKPEALAKCGFFYMGDGDRVSCPFCGIVIFNWQCGDEPIYEHKIHSSKCPFINGRDVGNVYMDADPREIYALAQSEDVCGFHHLQSQEKSEPEVKPVTEPVDGPGIAYNPPQSIEFITYGSRLASFKDWPIPDVISPAQLAESGFYYKGPVIDYLGRQYQDFVTCFHCGIALCQWNVEDDPWHEHAKFNLNCTYLHLVARQEISSTSAEETPIVTSEETIAMVTEETTAEVTSEEATPGVTSEENSELKPESSQQPSSESPSETLPETTSVVKVEEKSESKPSPQSSPQPSSETLPETTTTTMVKVEEESKSSPPAEPETKPETSSEVKAEETTPVKPEETVVNRDEKSESVSVSVTSSSPETSSETPIESSPSSSQSKPFIPYTWLPKPKSEDLCCKVCLDFQVGATFYPCMHTSCPLCAASLTNCPICRSNIERVIRLDYELNKTKISFYL